MKKQIKKLTTEYDRLNSIFHWNGYTLIFIYLFITFCILKNNIYDLWVNRLGRHMEIAYDWLNNSTLLNYITAIALTIIIIKILTDQIKDTYISSNKIIFAGWSLYILLNCKSWMYVDIFWKIDYKNLIGTGFLLYLVITCYKLIRQIIKCYKKKESCFNGFATETLKEDRLDVGWQDYVRSLVTKLLNTDISHGVFSVGIFNPWGSGKTSFLEKIEEELDNKAFIVKFNPWNSQSPNQIITDYFNTLKKELSPYYSTLSQPITRYANILAELDIETRITKISKIFISQQSQDLSTLKKNVEKCITALDKPVAVLIDDLDRLEKDELFEVLRLIRNTAQFKNMIYIVTYDRQHIIEMLAQKGVQSSKLYVEKIFGMEISLPDYEQDTLPQLLSIELKRMLAQEEQIYNALRSEIYKYENAQYTITLFLSNFRSVKRFANAFISNFNILRTSNNLHEIYLSDFFWLEVIHYVNPDFYQLLKDTPDAVLRRKDYRKTYFYYLEEGAHLELLDSDLKSLNDKITNHGYKGETIGMPFLKLLQLLFSAQKPKDKNNLRHIENYQKYFAFRRMKHQIASVEFSACLSQKEEIETNIQRWSKNKNKSLAFLFDTYPTSSLQLNSAKNFLFALITWSKYGRHSDLSYIINKKLELAAYNPELQTPLASYIKKLLSETIKDKPNRNTIASILSHSYYFDYLDEEEIGPLSLLSNKDIEEMAHENFQLFLEENKPVSPLDIILPKSKLRELVRSNYALAAIEGNGNFDGINLVFSDLKNLFKDKRPEYKKIIESMPLDPDEDNNYLNRLWKEINFYFGSPSNYKEFVQECIDITDKKKKNYFDSIGL